MTFLKIPMMVKNADNCRDTFEKWLYLLKNMDKMEAIPKVFLNDPVFQRLGKVARVAALKEEERTAYDASLKAYRDAYAIAKTERTEGFAEGHAEGRAEGRAEGIESVALNMMKSGVSDETIHEYTGLSHDQIVSLRNVLS